MSTGNTSYGTGALDNNTASNNSAFGVEAVGSNTTGTSNVGVGTNALLTNTTGNYNTAVGAASMGFNFTGMRNTAVGANAMEWVNGDRNTAIGTQALYGSAAGEEKEYALATGSDNTAVGAYAGIVNTVGFQNVMVGSSAGKNNTEGNANTVIGYKAGESNTTGSNNTCVGQLAGSAGVSTSNNTYVGGAAGMASTTSNNTFVGFHSGYSNTTGEQNTCVGVGTGSANVAGDYNTNMGAYSGPTADGCTNLTCVGYAGGSQLSGVESNTVVLGNSDVNRMYLGPALFSNMQMTDLLQTPNSSTAVAFIPLYSGSSMPPYPVVSNPPITVTYSPGGNNPVNVLYASTMWVGGMLLQMTTYIPNISIPQAYIQKGTFNVFTFPVPFPTACLGAIVAPYNTGNQSVTTSPVPQTNNPDYPYAPASPSQIIFYVNSSSSSQESIVAWGN